MRMVLAISGQDGMAGSNNLFLEVKHVDAAVRAALKNLKGEDEPLRYTLTDKGHKGLALRVSGGQATWMVKTSSYTKVLGYAYPPSHAWAVRGVVEPKEIAGHVQALMRNGEGHLVDAYLAARHTLKDHAKAVASLRPNATTWTLRECVDMTVKQRTAKNASKPLKPRSVEDWNNTFGKPELAVLINTPVSLIARGDMEMARNAFADAYGARPSTKLLTHFRSVMEHCAAFHSLEAGLVGVEPWWRMLASPFRTKARTRRPTIEDIAKTLLLAEEYTTKPLPGRTIRTAGVGPGTLAGLWWLVLTCQRADAGMKLKAYDFYPDPTPGREGWMLAAWDEGVMKGGKTHILPIPPRAWAVLEPLLKACRNHGKVDWAFPSEIGKDKATTRSGVYSVLKRLAKRDALLNEVRKQEIAAEVPEADRRADTRVDLFVANGILWWSLHDLRRALLKEMDERGMPGGASVVMAHELKSSESLNDDRLSALQLEEFKRLRAAKITLMAYGGAQFIKLKSEAMAAWTDAVLDEYTKQKVTAPTAPAA